MDQEDFVTRYLYGPWRRARGSRAIYQNIDGYNAAVMTDEHDPDVWASVLTRSGGKAGEWSREKYRTEEDAKRGVLKALAAKRGYA